MLIRLGRKKPKSLASVLRGAECYIALLLAAGVVLSLAPNAAPAASLPVACGGAACTGRGGPSQWVTYGSASLSQAGTAMNIFQSTDSAILNWASFDIAAGHSVNFQQPSANSIALNRIFQGDASKIYGQLTANGQLYLINPNGILFGAGSQTNLHSLTASTLNVSDEIFKNGVLSALEGGALKPAFSDEGGSAGDVMVEAGATINTASGGRVMLLAPNVTNAGAIRTDDGQTILAAGTKVYLQASDDPALRGLLVEVDSGGSATNLGEIIAARGNVSLVGLAVNQSGRVTATSSVNANGTIRLLARDTAEFAGSGSDRELRATHTAGGSVILGNGSVTQVLPESDDPTTVVDEQKLEPSRVEIMGEIVRLDENSLLRVPGGEVVVTATADPRTATESVTAATAARVHIASGAVIDVSGTTDTVLAMSRNELEVELRGNELKDSPLQRNGVLRGQKITIDINAGTPLANVDGALATIGRTIGERSATGGTVTIKSSGDIITQGGSKIDTSGGKVSYEAGEMHTTKLIGVDGRIYDIGDAAADRDYVGILGEQTRSNLKWGVTETWQSSLARGEYREGFHVGADAGTVHFQAPGLVLNGELRGEVTPGKYQRNPNDPANDNQLFNPAEVPRSGQLSIGIPIDNLSGIVNMQTPDVVLAADAIKDLDDLSAPSAAGNEVKLSTAMLERGGISRTKIYSNGRITLAADTTLNVAPGGELRLTGHDIDVSGSVRIPSGTVSLTTWGDTLGADPRVSPSLTVGAASSLDVSGLWVNDSAGSAGAGTGPVSIKGGSVALKSYGDLILNNGSVIDAGGGAWLQASGRVKAGDGGSISLGSGNKLPEATELVLGAELRGDALGKGGKLSITANAVRIEEPTKSSPTGEDKTLVLSPELFRSGGFREYGITANAGELVVAAGTEIRPQAQTRVLDGDLRRYETGADVRSFSRLETLPDYRRAPVNLTLAVTQSGINAGRRGGDLRVEEGASIVTDPGARVSLDADTRILFDGRIDAPAGAIDFLLRPPPAIEGIDIGYRADQGIWLGSQAELRAAGSVQYTPDPYGLLTGDVRDAGTINIIAQRGYVGIAEGALLDVSAVAAPLDLPAPGGVATERVTTAGAAGTINLVASEGMFVHGDLRADAAQGVGARSGNLDVVIMQGGAQYDASQQRPPGPAAAYVLNISASEGGPADFATYVADGVPNEFNGQAFIGAATIMNGGFAHFGARADDVIVFTDDVSLNVARSIQLDAPRLAVADGATVSIDAPYIALGNANKDRQNVASTTAASVVPPLGIGLELGGPGGAASSISISSQAGTAPTGAVTTAAIAPVGGSGTFSARGQLIDVIGNSVTQGIGALALTSDGDIRLRGMISPAGNTLTGALRTGADVTLQADQVYPTTLTNFTLAVEGSPEGTVTILPGGTDTPVLSAGGNLTISAPHILQQGVVKAPQGAITLDAEKTLVLDAGSKTSVSGEGQIVPFGKTQNDNQWFYPLNQTLVEFSAPPDKRVTLDAPSVDVRSGAVLDLSGGGDLQAYGFVPGPQGSRDILDDPGVYAVLPQLRDRFAPHDFANWFDGSNLDLSRADLTPGNSVYLSGVDGLEAGVYALLPAHYALLPGAYLVKPASGHQDLTADQSVRLLDGSTLVAGYQVNQGSGERDGRWSGYNVRPGSAALNESELHIARANNFYTERATEQLLPVPRLPRDAGAATLAATEQLILDGSIVAAHAGDARGAQLDISAKNIEVVAASTPAEVGVLHIDAARLDALGAESILLGGTRRSTVDGTEIATTAQQVRVADGVAMQAAEILFVATDEVRIGANAQLTAQADDGIAADRERLLLQGDGALLRLSAREQADVQRTGGTQANGVVNIGEGAALVASGSLTLDVSKDASWDATTVIQSPQLSFCASRIALGNAPGTASGLKLATAQLDRFNAQVLEFHSREDIAVYGPLELQAQELILAANGLRAEQLDADQKISIAATRLHLSNTAISTPAASAAGTGTLEVTADEIELGQGDFALNGFSAVDLRANGDIVVTGKGQLQTDADLSMNAARVTGTYDADYAFRASGDLTIYGAGDVLTKPSQEIGARLTFEGATLTHAGNIETPSGEVTLRATVGDVVIAPGARIDVSGADLDFVETIAPTWGGSVNLTSVAGNVRVDTGTTIDVSGAASGGRGGVLNVSATQGTVSVAGNLLGHAASGESKAVANIDAQSLGDFAALNRTLNAGGFGGGRELRQRGAGDLSIGADAPIVAEHVSVAADQGSVRVVAAQDAQGTPAAAIDARGARGGSVTLSARDNVVVESGAEIDASATHDQGRGGSVTLATVNGAIDLRAGSVVDVSGKAGGRGGEVLLRAPRSGNDVNITALQGEITGAERITAEAFTTVTATSIATANINGWKTELSNWMTANEAAITARLNPAGNTAFRLAPGLEVRAETGNLGLPTTANYVWDLSTWRYGASAAPGVLTLRAAGDVNLTASLSDGFSLPTGTLNDGESWNYRIVAGADFGAADVTAVKSVSEAAGKGSVVLANDKLVRTGTGDIAIHAAQDIKLSNTKSVIYTAGRPAPVLDNYAAKLPAVSYAMLGGDIELAAGKNIVGAAPEQLINDWLYRQGSINPDGTIKQNTGWGPVFAKFQQGVGALGGGDISIHAAGSVENFSAVIPTVGRLPGSVGTAPVATNLEVLGGGDLHVVAGTDIKGGIYYLGRGDGWLSAGNDIVKGKVAAKVSATEIYPILAAADGRYVLEAGGNAGVGAMFNPTLLAQVSGSFSGVERSFFLTYTPDASLRISALRGDVELGNTNNVITQFAPAKSPNPYNKYMLMFPGTINGFAPVGDIKVGGDSPLAMFPAAHGDLRLLAGKNVNSRDGYTSGFVLHGLNPERLPGVTTPFGSLGALNGLGLDRNSNFLLAGEPLHGDDPAAALIVARSGDIQGGFFIAKPATLWAGRDLRNLDLTVQNINPDDTTSLHAGRDLYYDTKRDGEGRRISDARKVEVSGPGRLDIDVGRNVDLAASGGVTTSGNRWNPLLPERGADITLTAGLGRAADYAGFAKAYLVDSDAYREALGEFMTNLGRDPTLEAFLQLTPREQQPLLVDIFFGELRASGREASQSRGGDYARGRNAVAALFPTAGDGPGYDGDISLFFSRIYTEGGGDINLLVPGGYINAGLASQPPDAPEKKASQLGVVAQRTGSVRTFSDGDFLVNQSRVFTLQGGDILLWSDHGNIDAGRGAKTAISIPPPKVVINPLTAAVSVDFSGAVSGSGIRAMLTDDAITPGDVDLIAPEGEVNAGDAGIGAAGNLNIAAQRVVGADNIQVGGISSGVPVVDTGSLSSSIAGAGAMASGVSKSAEESFESVSQVEDASATPIADAALTFLEIEVLGYGDEDNGDKPNGE